MIGNISLRLFLSFLVKKKRVCVFFLRGGLGNQLFQILNLIEISKKENFKVIFSDVDVRKNPRDKNGAAAFKLQFPELFDETKSVFKTNPILDYVLRIMRSRKLRMISIRNINFDHETSVTDKLFFSGNGYLQNPINISKLHGKFLPLNLGEYDRLVEKAEIAMHVRATDSLHSIGMLIEDSFYEKALNTLAPGQNTLIDVFSDDLDFAKELCARIGDHQFNFIEENYSLGAIELLACLSNYNSIIASKSTLCWWACNFATIKNRNAKIISTWQSSFHQATWIEGS